MNLAIAYTKCGFKFLDRGFRKNLVLIPGWATDYRIFSNLNLDYNYFLPIKSPLLNLAQTILDLLNRVHQDNISLFGYSLGGFLACDFASRYPEATDELILLSIRKNYDALALKEIESKLKKNRRAYLYKFYHSCFSDSDKEGLSWFRKNLLDEYLKTLSQDSLVSGLDYLSCARINPEHLRQIRKIRIFHGSEDLIAPVVEAVEIKSGLAQAEFNLLRGRGHLLFMNPGFKNIFYGVGKYTLTGTSKTLS